MDEEASECRLMGATPIQAVLLTMRSTERSITSDMCLSACLSTFGERVLLRCKHEAVDVSDTPQCERNVVPIFDHRASHNSLMARATCLVH
jgi:hypothetical protein